MKISTRVETKIVAVQRKSRWLMIRVVYAVAFMEDGKREMEKIGNENRMEQW